MTSRLGQLVFDTPTSSVSEAALSGVSIKPPSLLANIQQSFRSDEDIARDLQEGRAEALTLLFKRHSALIFAIARRILRNDAEAEDAVQQIFLDVFRSIHQFQPARGPFKSWLLMFAYQRAFNARRALSSSRYFQTDTFEESASPKSSYETDDSILITQLLNTLEPRQRRTIELIYGEGLTAIEVALRTGESVRVVRHNLYRGLEKIRESLSLPVIKGGRR